MIDARGRVVATETVYPHPPQKQRAAAKETLVQLLRDHRCTVVGVGNGTACRETEELVLELCKEVRQQWRTYYSPPMLFFLKKKEER